MADRKIRGLCYNCDEKWARGHKCKEQKLFLMDVPSPPTSQEPIIKEPEEKTLEVTFASEVEQLCNTPRTRN